MCIFSRDIAISAYKTGPLTLPCPGVLRSLRLVRSIPVVGFQKFRGVNSVDYRLSFHSRFQQIAMLNTETGELIESRLEHGNGEAKKFYSEL
jgi:hypothetical protein